MSADIDDLVNSLIGDADRLRLPSPERLRSRAAGRARRPMLAIVGAAAVTVAVVAGISAAVLNGRNGTMPPGGGSTASGTPTPSDPPTTTPTSPPAQPPCTAASLTFDSAREGVGMGSVIVAYRVRNIGSIACTVKGSPVLRYAPPTGPTSPVPAQHGPTDGDPVILAPGAVAEFEIHHVNGYGGYQPDAPECANPRTYANVGVELGDGSTVALADHSTIEVQCGELFVGPWIPSR